MEICSKYSSASCVIYGSYEWKRIVYEYSGMTCKITTRTAKRNMSVYVPYEEEVKVNVYW